MSSDSMSLPSHRFIADEKYNNGTKINNINQQNVIEKELDININRTKSDISYNNDNP